MKCSNCGTEIADNAVFCPSCGAKQAKQPQNRPVCRSCGAPLKAGAQFCPACGAKVEAAQAAPQAPQPAPHAVQPAAEPAEAAEPAHKLNVKPIQWPAPPPPSKIFVTSTSQVPVITDEMLAAHKAQQQAQKAAEAWKKSE